MLDEFRPGPNQEKRKNERISVRQIIDMEYPRETFFNAEWLNVSEGGMMCRSKYSIEPLSKVYFIIEVPEESEDQGRLIKAEGMVMHTRTEGEYTVFGVAFGDISESERAAIMSYLETHPNQIR